MAITLRGIASNNSIDGTNVTVTLPGGVAQDDVVFGAYAGGHTSNVNLTTITTGYTELADLYADDTSDTNLGVYRKVQGATPDSTVEYSIAGGSASVALAGAVMVLDGVDTTTPEDATTTTATAANDAIPNPPSIVTATAAAWVLAIGASSEADVPTAPTNYSDLIEDQGIDTQPANIMMARREIASPGTEDPGTFGGIAGQGTDSWCAATVAARPAPAGSSDITPPQGNLALSATAPASVQDIRRESPQGDLVLSSTAPTVAQDVRRDPGQANLVLSADAPTVARTDNRDIAPAAGDLVLSATAPGILVGVDLSPAAGQLVLSAAAPAAVQDIRRDPPQGDLLLSTTAPNSVQDIRRDPSAGDLLLSTTAPTVERTDNRNISPAAGDLTLSTTAPSVLTGANNISPDAGQLVFSPTAPQLALTEHRNISPDAGQMVLSTLAPTVAQAANINISPATVDLVLSSLAPAATIGIPCQYEIRSPAATIYTQRQAATGGTGGDFPGLPWMPTGGGEIYTPRTAAVSTYTPRPPAAGSGKVCDEE